MNSCEKTMENIGLANVFHKFVVFQKIFWLVQEILSHGKTRPMFSKFMENIGQWNLWFSNVFHEFHEFP